MGVTLRAPEAAVDVYPPGLILILLAPLVAQVNVVLAPESIVEGVAVKEVMLGLETTITVTVLVVVRFPLLAVRV